MIRATLLLLSIILLAGNTGKSQEVRNNETFQINKSAKDSFRLATTRIDTTDGVAPKLREGLSAILFPGFLGDVTEPFDSSGNTGFELPCQCALANDTLSIVSALGYEGAFGYVAQATKSSATSYYMQYGKGWEWEYAGRVFKDEIQVASLRTNLTISKKFPPKLNDRLYGWFYIDTPVFYEFDDGEKVKQRHLLKIFFSCKVYPDIY